MAMEDHASPTGRRHSSRGGELVQSRLGSGALILRSLLSPQ
jgi:hypothetical protein